MDMIGFADRKKPGEGTLSDLYARVLVLQDALGRKLVLVSADLCVLPDAFNEALAKEIGRRHGLITRADHAVRDAHAQWPLGQGRRPADRRGAGTPAPASAPTAVEDESATEDLSQRGAAYARRLRKLLLTSVDEARRTWNRAALYGVGECTLSVNRRKMVNGEAWSFVPNPEGVVDQAVPVLKVASPTGAVKAIVYGYACHNTVLGGPPGGEGTWAKYVERHGHMPETYYMWSGDYEGYAQADLEQAYSGATVMYIAGCGGDVMAPRQSDDDELAQHSQKSGRQLADAVQAVLGGQMKPVNPQARAAFKTLDLPVDKNGQPLPPCTTRWRSGNSATISPGSASWARPCVDYSLRLKSELGENTWVSAYTNGVPCYIASKRVLAEGGYEGTITAARSLPRRLKTISSRPCRSLSATCAAGTACQTRAMIPRKKTQEYLLTIRLIPRRIPQVGSMPGAWS